MYPHTALLGAVIDWLSSSHDSQLLNSLKVLQAITTYAVTTYAITTYAMNRYAITT